MLCVRHVSKTDMIKTSVAVFRLCSVTGISLFICLQLASFLIMFAILDVFVISGTQEKKTKTSDIIVYLCSTTAPH